MNEHKPYNEVETVIYGTFLLGADIALAILSGASLGILVLLATLIKWCANGIMILIAWSKGDKQALSTGRVIAKFAVNAIPILPTLTTIFLIERYIHNHPESFAAKTAAKTAGATSGKPAGISKTSDITKTAKQMNIPKPIE